MKWLRVPLDVLASAVLMLAGCLLLLPAYVAVMPARKRQENVVLFVSFIGLMEIAKSNPPELVEKFYTRPGFRRSYVLFVGREPRAVERLGRSLIGVNGATGLSDRLFSWLPGAAQLANEVAALVISVRMIRRLRPKAVETWVPTRITPRVLVLAWLYPARLIAQVRGNLDLINHSRGRGGLLPVKGRFATPLSFLADKWLYQLFFRRCDLVIGYNINNLQNAISNGADPKKTRLLRIRFDRSILDAPARARDEIEGFPREGRILIAWSRFSPEKLIYETLQAVAPVLRRHRDLRFVLIGDGPDFARIERLVAQEQIGDQVLFLGYRGRDDIAAAARHADLVLVPYGGSSLVEAALLGRPIAAFDVEWHNEVIRPGETGFLAELADLSSMTQAVEIALSDPALAARYAEACRMLVTRMFDPAEVDARERRIYERFHRAPA